MNSNKIMIKFLQINLNNSPAAHDILNKTVREKSIGIVLGSEVNKSRVESENWYRDRKRNVGIKIVGSNVDVKASGDGFGYVWVAVKDIQIFSCYISPNVPFLEFKRFVDGIKSEVISLKYKRFIIGGDLNAKSFLWQSAREDDRGTFLAEVISELGMEVLNSGTKPTFIRGGCSSIIDVTFCSGNLVSKIGKWEVLDDETMSDHEYLYFELSDERRVRAGGEGGNANIRWKYNEEKVDDFRNKIRECFIDDRYDAESCTKLLLEVCEKVFKVNIRIKNRKPIYWWTEKIAEKRKECHKQKRKMVRINKKRDVTEEEKKDIRRRYYELKEELRREINVEKQKKWSELCNDLNRDVWGLGYKIVCKKFKFFSNKKLEVEEKIKIAENLFPKDEKIVWTKKEMREDEIPLFTMEEVAEAIEKSKNKKTPGPDGISAEIVKLFFREKPDICLSMFNDALKQGTFPSVWKKGKLVLLDKGKKDEMGKMTYRPICLLNVMGKVLEQLIKVRLGNEINSKGGLSENQYGFREGKSTIDAVKKVMDCAGKAKKAGKLCAITMIDVKNAFNCVPWRGIIDEMERRKNSDYLINIFCSYLQDRHLVIDDASGRKSVRDRVIGGEIMNVSGENTGRENGGGEYRERAEGGGDRGQEIECITDNREIIREVVTVEERHSGGEIVREQENEVSNEGEDVIIVSEGETVMVLSCGVPQGSIVGPPLWNFYYDDLVRMPLPASSEIVAYADDICVVTVGESREILERNINEAVKKIVRWLKVHKLEIAAQKTEVVLLVCKRVCKEIEITVENQKIKSKKSAKYLGVYLEQGMKMRSHLKYTVEKSERTAGNLAHLMPNVNGPDNDKRKILASVVYSSLLYGAPVWGDIVRWKKYINMLERVQRKVMLRLARAYRTTSTPALQVITGSLPVELMVEERGRLYELRQENFSKEEKREKEDEIKRILFEKWKEKWGLELERAQWTKRLIRDIEKWRNKKHGYLTYELSQFLTGHGNFNTYLFRFKIKRSERCVYCGEKDTPEHTVLECEEFEEERERYRLETGDILSVENIVEKMLESEKKWKKISGLIGEIMKRKARDERVRALDNVPR